LTAPRWVTALAALVAVIIITLNVKLIADQFTG
jgi:Mn2+/Fe2+ NRAMP family transporter